MSGQLLAPNTGAAEPSSRAGNLQAEPATVPLDKSLPHHNERRRHGINLWKKRIASLKTQTLPPSATHAALEQLRAQSVSLPQQEAKATDRNHPDH